MSFSFSPRTWIGFFGVLVAATLVAEVLVVQTSSFNQHPDLLSFAVTFDLTIGIPLAYYLLISRKLHVTPASALVVFLLYTGLAGLILPAGHQTYLRLVEKALLLTEGGLLVYGVVTQNTFSQTSQRSSSYYRYLQQSSQTRVVRG